MACLVCATCKSRQA